MQRTRSSEFEVELRGIRKTFGPVVANEEVNLRVRKGSIHAIVGENGAGKSTAMKILYGQYTHDEGEIWVGGARREWRSSADAIEAGLGMVHQHFMLAETHDSIDNILLGTERIPFALLPYRKAKERLLQLMQEYRMEIDLDRPVGELPVGMQQRIEILKLLYRDSNILILDEPTAVLAPTEIETLFKTLKGMADKGKTILIITHKLKEVMSLADRVTIFRAGKVVGEKEVSSTSPQEIAALMVGHGVELEASAPRSAPQKEIILEVRDIEPKDPHSRFKRASFRLHSGEILGVAGVEGNGQSELLRLLFHPREELRKGSYSLLGRDVSHRTGSQLRCNFPVAIFPENRLKEALLLQRDAKENFLLGKQRYSRFRKWKAFLHWKEVERETKAAIEEYDVRPKDVSTLAREYSGGNQQKLVVARELWNQPKFLLAAQPTRGVDIGAIESIHHRLIELRNSGSGILLFSSELDEVLKLSDRLLVMYRGQVVGSFARSEFDEKKIGMLMCNGTLDRGAV